MPTYTYVCPKCGHKFDLFHSIMDDSDKECPICTETAVRQFGGGSMISSGSSRNVAASAPPPSTGFS